VVGAVQLSDSTSTTSSVLAATPTAVKASFDLADAALPKAGGTLTGNVILDNQVDARFREATANGTNYVGFQAPATIAADVLWTLPATDGTSAQVLSTNGSGTLSWAAAGSGIISGTAVASTSGTSIDFTSIPSGVKRITVMMDGVSVSGTGSHLIQLGDSGGIETTSYVTFTSLQRNSNYPQAIQSVAGFPLFSFEASILITGNLIINKLNNNTWVASGTSLCVGSTSAGTIVTSGSKTLSATLDRVRITTVNGTDTFDAGSINILYES